MIKSLGNCAVVVGAQLGDEGKGKIVDILSKEYDVVARAAGGTNAGHTIEIENKQFILHLIPSGILQGKTCLIGNGCVVHLPSLLEEMKMLEEKGINLEQKIFISEKAHILFDFHKQLDGLFEDRKGKKKIGTTKQGISPAYTSKVARNGIRIGVLTNDFDTFEKQLRILVQETEDLYQIKLDVEAKLILYASLRDVFKNKVIDTAKYVSEIMNNNKKVLIEGAQGTMLDIDHGTYPYVTSSNTCVGGSCTGIGIPPKKLDSVVAIVKAYTTRVGEGPFPTELQGKDGEMLRQIGHEYGATTGRQRRCGWLDMVQLKFAHRINGFTHINLTKLDVLSGFKEIKIGVKYFLNNKEVFDIPINEKDQKKLKIEYITLSGWQENISDCKKYEDLPTKAQKYIETIEKMLEIKINFIGVGPKRDQLIIR